jgi:hypothetical protein
MPNNIHETKRFIMKKMVEAFKMNNGVEHCLTSKTTTTQELPQPLGLAQITSCYNEIHSVKKKTTVYLSLETY